MDIRNDLALRGDVYILLVWPQIWGREEESAA